MKDIRIILSSIAAISYFILGYLYLAYFNPHEDAYIMFRYVDMFTQGYGITYYPGGEPTEGATDFLWFIILSFLTKIGIDVAIAAILLNALGVFFISYTYSDIIFTLKDKKLAYLLSAFAILWLAFLPIIAALGGFSVFLYCGIIVITLHTIHKRKRIIWVPILSILIALFRPDGVILGCVFTIIGFFLINKEKRGNYFYSMGLAFTIGITYFIGRYLYFGELLPLPLYVKQSANLSISIGRNLDPFLNIRYGIAISLFLLLFIFQNKNKKKEVLILIIPSIIFFIIISLAQQSQNIAYRFQAPVLYMCYYVFLVLLTNILNNSAIKHVKLYFSIGYLLIFSFVFYTIYYNSFIDRIKEYADNNKNYMDTFPLKLNKEIFKAGDIFALTEAGRLAYWSNKAVRIVDLIGLNTKEAAKEPVNYKYLIDLNPDITMTFMMLDFNNPENVYWVKDLELAKKAFLYSENDKYSTSITREKNAAIQVRAYLVDKWDEYDIFFVKYTKGLFLHVYAIKKNRNQSEILYNLLNQSFNNSKSYLELKNGNQ